MRLKFSKKRKKHTVLYGMLLVFVMPCTPAYADTKSILNQFGFESNSPVKNIARSFGWSFVTGLQWLVSGLESAVYSINSTLGGFFTSSAVKQLGSKKIIPIAMALIGVLILIIGISTIVKPQRFTTIISNIIVGVTIAIALPTLLSVAYDFTDQAILFINSDSAGNMQSLSDKILVDNVIDMTQYDTDDFKSINLKYKSYYATPGAPSDKITTINPTETVDPDKMRNKDVWKNRVVTDQNGKQTLQELNSGYIGWVNVPLMSEYYYRWKIDWLNIISTLLITGIALILSGIKIARLLYELAIHQIATQVIALLDVMTAQRLKKCIQMLLATFVTLIGVFFMLQIYLIGMDYISKITNIPLKLILMVALAWSVIDGPNLFEQLFGVDAGLHGAMQTIYGIKAAGGALAGGAAVLGGRSLLEKVKAQGIIGTARGAIGAVSGFAGGAGGMAAGLAGGMVDNVRRVNAARAGQNQNHANSPVQNGSGPAQAHKTQNQPVAKSRATSGTSGPSQKNNQRSPSDTSGTNRPTGTAYADHSTSAAGEVSDTAQTVNSGPEASSVPDGKSYQRGKVSGYATETLGGYIRSKVARSSPVASARRMYSLTRNSMQARADKLVSRENGIRDIQSKDPEISRHDAEKQAKRQMKAEKNIREDLQTHQPLRRPKGSDRK